MGTNGRDDGRFKDSAGFLAPVEAAEPRRPSENDDFVYDFTGLHRPELLDLALILTARLQAGPDHRVWVRALPPATAHVLRVLGLTHLFRPYPGSSGALN